MSLPPLSSRPLAEIKSWNLEQKVVFIKWALDVIYDPKNLSVPMKNDVFTRLQQMVLVDPRHLQLINHILQQRLHNPKASILMQSKL